MSLLKLLNMTVYMTPPTAMAKQGVFVSIFVVILPLSAERVERLFGRFRGEKMVDSWRKTQIRRHPGCHGAARSAVSEWLGSLFRCGGGRAGYRRRCVQIRPIWSKE